MKTAAPRAALAAALLVCCVALAACNGGSSASPAGVLPQQQGAIRSHAAASPTPIPFLYQTVDDPISNVNELTAIDSAMEIVGSIGNGQPSNPYQGYISNAPYTSLTPIGYVGAAGIVITSLSVTASKTVFAGFVVSPPQLRGTWGYLNINGIPTLAKDRKGGKGSLIVTEILGLSDTGMAVGFFKSNSGSGVNVPFLLELAGMKFKILNPPNSQNGAEATGINDLGDITGWVSGKGAGTTGFMEHAATYYSLAYPGAKSTEALSLNNHDQVVGFYEDGKGTKHGFVLTNPLQASGQVWQTIDETNAAQGTVVTGINANQDICGYYIDSSGIQHGFVAVPSAS
jgi:hypothetical protein